MKKLNNSRRDFIKKSVASALAFHYFPNLYAGIAASDKVLVAHIGINGMGTSHLNWFAHLPEVEVAALCDVDAQHLAKAQKRLTEIHPNQKAELFSDFRRILENKDIDAISCATPDHWHAQIAIMAFQAGKDVYGEKPLSYSVKEGQLMLAAQQKYKRVFQLGTQIHAGDNYHRVAELIQAGVIGKVHTVKLWKTGEPPLIEKASYGTVPSHFNYDFWQGPAPKKAYSPEHCHFNYRYFLDYSGGVFQDFWCHIADIVWWSIAPQKLKTVKANGIKSDGIGDTPKAINVDYGFKDLKLNWSSTPPNVAGAAGRHIGAYFEGEKGSLICDYGSREIRLNGEVMNDVDSVPKSIVRSPGHQQNFIDCVKSRNKPESDLSYARLMTLPMHLGLISWRLGRELRWNHKKEEFVNDSAANALLFRPYRKGYDWI